MGASGDSTKRLVARTAVVKRPLARGRPFACQVMRLFEMRFLKHKRYCNEGSRTALALALVSWRKCAPQNVLVRQPA